MTPKRTTRTPSRARKPRRDWKTGWLEAFGRTGMVSAACEQTGVARSTVYDARQGDEDFALAWADIEEKTTELMEREAYRRAVEGVQKPVVSAGKHVTDVMEYSDQLLIFMLKARRPERFRDNVKVEHSGSIRKDVVVDVVPDEDRRQQVAEMLADVLGDDA